MGGDNRDSYQLDEIDKRIIYELMADARNMSPPVISEELDVSAATIRNRIAQLEEYGIIEGYHTSVNFEHAEGSMKSLLLCHAPLKDLEQVVKQIVTVPGVINVRELSGGKMNLHVLVVGSDTADLRRIRQNLEQLNITIKDESLLQQECHLPYIPFGPADRSHRESLTDYISFTDGAELAEVTVPADASIAGLTLEEAVRDDILDEETLVISIERDGTIITPHGNTTIHPDDIMTVLSAGETSGFALEELHE